MIGQIISIRDVATDIREFVLRLDSSVRFIPGQYVSLAFEDKSLFRRSYSVIRYDALQHTIDIMLKKQGDFSSRMFGLNVNDKLFVYGPYGKFTLKENHHLVFIAGGIGVVPLYSMMLHALTFHDSKIRFFYSCKTAADMALKNDFELLHDKRVDVRLYFTRESKKKRFSVSEVKSIADFKKYDYYVCGPQPMMEDVITGLKNIGIDEKNIRTESYR